MLGRLARHFGEGLTVTLQQRHSLLIEGAAPATLLVKGAHLAGSTTLLVDQNGAKLNGLLPAGCRFTIAGGATVYELASDAVASQASDLSLALVVGLAAPAADNALLTITRGYAEHAGLPVARLSADDGELDDNLDTRSRRFLLSAVDSPIEPAVGMLCISDKTEYIHARQSIGSGATAGWELTVGERRP